MNIVNSESSINYNREAFKITNNFGFQFQIKEMILQR